MMCFTDQLLRRSFSFSCLVTSGIIWAGLASISYFIGLVMFAYYDKEGCDPLKTGQVGVANQVNIILTYEPK